MKNTLFILLFSIYQIVAAQTDNNEKPNNQGCSYNKKTSDLSDTDYRRDDRKARFDSISKVVSASVEKHHKL